jgi:hypothetical protein
LKKKLISETDWGTDKDLDTVTWVVEEAFVKDLVDRKKIKKEF